DWLRLGDHPALVQEAVATLGSPSLDEDARSYVLSRYTGAVAGTAHRIVGNPAPAVAAQLPAPLVQWGLARPGGGDLPGGEDALAALAFARAVAGAVTEAKEWLQACRTDLPETAHLVRVARQFIALDALALEEDGLFPQLSALTGEMDGRLPVDGALPSRLDLLEVSITAARALHLGGSAMAYSRMLEIQLR